MTRAKAPETWTQFRDRAHRLAPYMYQECSPQEFRLIFQCADPKPAKQIASEMGLELSFLRKLLKTNTDRGLIRIVGEETGKTRAAWLYQAVDPNEFAQKRAAQIDAANPFRLTPAQIAESRALHSREAL